MTAVIINRPDFQIIRGGVWEWQAWIQFWTYCQGLPWLVLMSTQCRGRGRIIGSGFTKRYCLSKINQDWCFVSVRAEQWAGPGGDSRGRAWRPRHLEEIAGITIKPTFSTLSAITRVFSASCQLRGLSEDTLNNREVSWMNVSISIAHRVNNHSYVWQW